MGSRCRHNGMLHRSERRTRLETGEGQIDKRFAVGNSMHTDIRIQLYRYQVGLL